MSEDSINKLAEDYFRITGLRISVIDPEGRITQGNCHCRCAGMDEKCSQVRLRSVDESAKWGEPFLCFCPQGLLMWGVPLMVNSLVTGGLIVDGVELDESGSKLSSGMDVLDAAYALQRLAEQYNLTNSSFLELKRRESQSESRKAEAIHELKGKGYDSIREIYLKEEAGLMSAIKRGDRKEAREIINRVLVGIYFFGRRRPDLLKSFILELVVTMCRSAVEAGGDPSELLGVNYSSVTDLAKIDTEEELTGWLVSMLERVMDAIRTHREYPTTVLLNTALAFMEEHLAEDISRDQVANIACLSPSHFSRVMKDKFGRSFTEILTSMRIEKARELLVTSEKSIIEIGSLCGFADQSYFTKVFQKHTGCTPGEYRQRTRSTLR